jgi:hypothetical protein
MKTQSVPEKYSQLSDAQETCSVNFRKEFMETLRVDGFTTPGNGLPN